MRRLPFISTCCFGLALWVALLVAGGFGLYASTNWQILSQDGGAHSPSIDAIRFTDAHHGWALTTFQLSETNDGGQTWTSRLESDEGQTAFYAFDFVSPEQGFIVGVRRKGAGRAALILSTNDGGRNWQENSFSVSSPNAKTSCQLNSVSFCHPQVGWAAGANLILHTMDGGQTWETQRSDHREETLFGVACVSPERAWAVGQDGLILHTRDGGLTWNRQDSETTDNLVRVRFFGENGWIVGGLAGKSTLLRTRDGGENWERVPLDTSEALLDININDQQGWIAGMNGTILHTDNGGQSWHQEKSPTGNSLASVFLLNQQQVWISGDKRTILRLVD